MQVDADSRAEGERQFCQHPCLPRGSNVMSRQQVPCLVFPDQSSCHTGQPAPTERFPWFHVAARESSERPPHERRSRRWPPGEQRCEPVEEQVDRPWIGCRGRGECRVGHVRGVDGSSQATCVQGGGQRIEVGLARLRCVERLESASRREQQGRRVAPALDRERNSSP